MAISSLSVTYFSMVGAPSANATVGGVAPAANESAVKKASCEDHAQRPRRNVLFDAMMSALRELGVGQPAASAGGSTTGTPATPAAGTSAPATSPAPAADTAAGTAATGTPAPKLEDAVLSFAHALWQALRGDEGSRDRRGHGDDGDGDRRNHHHHHHRRHERDYSGLASRIEALAVRIETGTPAAAPGATPAAGTPPKLPGVDPVPMDAAAPNAPSVASTAAIPAPAVANTLSASPAVATTTVKGSLAESFAAMLKLLRGGDQPAATPVPEASLASFLHSLARGLDADRSAPSMSVVGVMINVSA